MLDRRKSFNINICLSYVGGPVLPLRGLVAHRDDAYWVQSINSASVERMLWPGLKFHRVCWAFVERWIYRIEIFIAYEIGRYPRSHHTIKRLINLGHITSTKAWLDVFIEDFVSLWNFTFVCSVRPITERVVWLSRPISCGREYSSSLSTQSQSCWATSAALSKTLPSSYAAT